MKRTIEEERIWEDQENLRDFLGFLQERVPDYDELWDEFEKTHLMKEKQKLYCKNCGGLLEQVSTTVGDPEGIRHDQKCTDCGQMHGVTKAAIYQMGYGAAGHIFNLDKNIK